MSGATEEAWRVTFSEIVSPIEAIIEEARNGRMFILVSGRWMRSAVPHGKRGRRRP